MPVGERDPVSGYLLTGHEWNGITELNTPIPKLVYLCLIVTTMFSIGYWLLMPAWPTWSSYTRGWLGADDRAAVTASVKQAAADRSVWMDQVESRSYAELQADPPLMAAVRETGRALFGDNCAACHGREALGGTGFPNLTTASWLWGGSPEAISQTIRVGVNAAHPDSRVSQMPAFGRDGVLKRDEIENVVAYVRSLSKSANGRDPAEKIAAGKAVFAANCAACHGAEAKGNPEQGAPDLINHQKMYGNDERAIYMVVWGGLQGHMPSWEGRLSPLDVKIVTLYLLDLRKPRP